MSRTRSAGTLLVLALLLWGGVAWAQDATLYELNESMKLVKESDEPPHRVAKSAMMGTARAGTPVCRAPAGAPPCTINAKGSSDVDLTTGLGTFSGDFKVVVELPDGSSNPFDSPEFVVLEGQFAGVMNFSTALVQRPPAPYGTVTGFLTIGDGETRVPFTGTFYMPFACPDDLTKATACYLDFNPADPSLPFVRVSDRERALGYAMVKFEVTFP